MENFLAADESRINMFCLEKTEAPIYNLIDYERKNSCFEDERITSCTYNQYGGDVFMYTTSTGKIHICDLRASSNFQNKPSLAFDVNGKNTKLSANLYAKWTNCVSEAKFSSNQN